MTAWLNDRLALLGVGEIVRKRHLLVGVTAVYAVLALGVYLASGLGQWSPQFTPVGKSLGLVVGFFFLPSLAEELLWRWGLIPPRHTGEINRKSMTSIALSSLVFTAAHPLAATLFVPHAREVFYRPEFLAIVLLLGLACGASYVIAKSIWPAVLLHWVTVLAWKFLLGGPFILLGH